MTGSTQRLKPPNRTPATFADINAARCSGCGRCIAVCEPAIIAFEKQGWRKVAVLQQRQHCTGCGLCAAACPIDVIRMLKNR